jgi:hypothetical protein
MERRRRWRKNFSKSVDDAAEEIWQRIELGLRDARAVEQI